MKQPQFDVVMGELKKQGERIALLEARLSAYLEKKATIEVLDDGAEAFELALAQYVPQPATGAIGVVNG